MLTKIETKNYRNLDLEEGVSLGALNIFIGPNGSGKSNLTKALRFLQEGLIDSPDQRRGVSSFESAIAEFGFEKVLDASVKMPATMKLKLAFDLINNLEHVLEVELDVKKETSVDLMTEQYYAAPKSDPEHSKQFFYQSHVSSGVASYLDDEGETRSLKGLSANEFAIKEIAKKIGVKNWAELIFSEMRDWGFYESARMNLEWIRHVTPERGSTDHRLAPSGANLIPVINELFQNDIDFEERMLAAMRELFPQTRRLRIGDVGRTSLSLEWWVNDIDTPFYLDQMSDGTVRMLCWATVLLSPKKHKLIIIDEPEAGVHPAWLRVLAGWIAEAARETQVIISTHSPDLLDFFTDDLNSVLVFTESSKRNHYSISTIDRARIDEQLKEGWQLGDLYRVGEPAVGGWPW